MENKPGPKLEKIATSNLDLLLSYLLLYSDSIEDKEPDDVNKLAQVIEVNHLSPASLYKRKNGIEFVTSFERYSVFYTIGECTYIFEDSTQGLSINMVDPNGGNPREGSLIAAKNILAFTDTMDIGDRYLVYFDDNYNIIKTEEK